MLIDKIIERIENEKNYIENIPENTGKETPIVQEMSKQAKIMKSFLNCDCKYYPVNSEDNDIICGYLESLQRSKEGDFIPIIVDISNNLLNAVIMNAVIDSDDDSESIMDLGIREDTNVEDFFKNGTIDFETSEVIERYRKNMISKDFSNGKELLDEMIDNNREYFGGYELERDELEVEDDPTADMDDLDFEEQIEKQGEILIAEIPVKNPWEIFAYIPFGGWNDCPGNEDIMAISKYWFEKYGAIPFAISHNTLEYIVEKPVDDEDKIRFTEEFYAFCPDSVDKYMESFNIDKLAKKIYKNKLWNFQWN
ncbi:DUF4253 domain-containing protein [Peptacetobacter sp.]|uniref:DUF4253 domain-containing protein n=1 Tax=Peptacetobacter sp. TaxID=2991975 RepID=UPI002637271D|nr:DUF4253 domain-containing protein [Peptacetobacter sp.]